MLINLSSPIEPPPKYMDGSSDGKKANIRRAPSQIELAEGDNEVHITAGSGSRDSNSSLKNDKPFHAAIDDDKDGMKQRKEISMVIPLD